jgi:ribosomal protein S18 acetylase RimI-like enzyme
LIRTVEDYPKEEIRLTNVSVRDYEERDLAACRSLWAELTQWHRDIYEDETIGGSEPGQYFDEHLRKAGPQHLMVAIDGQKVVGLIGYLTEGEEVEIEPLIVGASHRGMGIGTMMVNSVIKRVRGQGLKFLSVRPVARNKKAIKFFRQKGFDKIGRVEMFIDFSGRKWKDDLQLFDFEFGY